MIGQEEGEHRATKDTMKNCGGGDGILTKNTMEADYFLSKYINDEIFLSQGLTTPSFIGILSMLFGLCYLSGPSPSRGRDLADRRVRHRRRAMQLVLAGGALLNGVRHLDAARQRRTARVIISVSIQSRGCGPGFFHALFPAGCGVV